MTSTNSPTADFPGNPLDPVKAQAFVAHGPAPTIRTETRIRVDTNGGSVVVKLAFWIDADPKPFVWVDMTTKQTLDLLLRLISAVGPARWLGPEAIGEDGKAILARIAE
jgi:hypothetical protein